MTYENYRIEDEDTTGVPSEPTEGEPKEKEEEEKGESEGGENV